MKLIDIPQEKQQELIQHAIDYINDCQPSGYGCDLHNTIFNSDYYIIGNYQAEEWLKSIGVFFAIEEIKEYENDNFGEVNTDFSSPENVVNMFVYIYGELILQESKTLEKAWNKLLDEDDRQAIIQELEAI